MEDFDLPPCSPIEDILMRSKRPRPSEPIERETRPFKKTTKRPLASTRYRTPGGPNASGCNLVPCIPCIKGWENGPRRPCVTAKDDQQCRDCPDPFSCRMPISDDLGDFEYLRPDCIKLHKMVMKSSNGLRVDKHEWDRQLHDVLVRLSTPHLAGAVLKQTQKVDVLETSVGDRFANTQTKISDLYSQLDVEKQERAKLQGEIHDLQRKVNELSARHTPDTKKDSDEQGDTYESDESQSEAEDNHEPVAAPAETGNDEVA